MPYNSDGIGFQDTDTSEAAANAQRLKASTVRAMVLQQLHREVFGLTADEIAERINVHFLSVRPRLSELRNDGKILDTGIRRVGQFGKDQIVWCIA